MEINVKEDLSLFYQLLNRILTTRQATIEENYPLRLHIEEHNYFGGPLFFTTNGRRREYSALRIDENTIQVNNIDGAFVQFDFVEYYEPLDLTTLYFHFTINEKDYTPFLEVEEGGIIRILVSNDMLPYCKENSCKENLCKESHSIGILDISINVTDIAGKTIHVISEKIIQKLETTKRWQEAQIIYGLQLPIATLDENSLKIIKQLIDEAVEAAIGRPQGQHGRLGVDFVVGSSILGTP